MTTWRLILVVAVAVMVGFVGGVWFIGSGVGFTLIRAPQVAPARAVAQQIEYIPRHNPDRGTRAATKDQTTVEAVGVPEPVNISGGWGGLGRLAERSDLMPSPGYTWEVEPREFRIDQEWHKSIDGRFMIAVPSFEPKTDRLRVSLVQSTRTRDAAIPLRLVLFDAAGNRFVARVTSQGHSGGMGGHVDYTRHDWDDVPAVNQESFAFCGVERVVPESARLAAETARVAAQRKGVCLLPPPRLGAPFEFDLATVSGKRVRSSDLKGKAILVVLTGPSPRGPISLGSIRASIPEQDLAVLNVSFEATSEAVQKAAQPLGEPTYLVHVPNEPEIRQLWREGAEIQGLPMYWIVDPAGILRFQEQWTDIADRLATVLGRPTQRGRFEAAVREAQIRADVEREARFPRPEPAVSSEPVRAGAKGGP